MSLNILPGVPVVIIPEPIDEMTTSVIARHRITFLFVFPPLVAKLAKTHRLTTNAKTASSLSTRAEGRRLNSLSSIP
jgi:hypothetical protein